MNLKLPEVFASRRRGHRSMAFVLVGIIALGAYATVLRFPDSSVPGWVLAARRQAVSTALRGQDVIRRLRTARGLSINKGDDFGTGLIGVGSSPLTTELGSLSSKRTAANPVFAAAVVQMLYEAGVRRGDVVAVGMTGSYPGFNLDVDAAIDAMGAQPVAISSVGASAYGANEINLTWLDMERALFEAGVIHHLSVSVAPGGSLIGRGAVVRRRVAERSGYPLLPVLPQAQFVKFTERTYVREVTKLNRPIKAWIDVGGSSVNVGSSSAEAIIRPGLSRPHWSPFQASRLGVTGWMGRQGIPIIAIVNVGRLARAFGIPFDPYLEPHARDLPAPPANPIWLAVALVFIVALVALAHRLGWFRVPNWELPPGLRRAMRHAGAPSASPGRPEANGHAGTERGEGGADRLPTTAEGPSAVSQRSIEPRRST